MQPIQPIQKGQSIELSIEKLAFGGSGLGKWEGKTTFIPHTIPGDRVEASLTKIKPNYLEAKLLRVLKPSELRIEPRCKHFGVCGGCTFQNLSYEDQLRFKAEQVRETLEHLGGFSAEESADLIRPILGCKEPWDYRNKMEFSFGRSAQGEVMLGLHLPERHHDVFDLEECFLPSGIFAELVKEVRDFAKQEGLAVFDNRTQDGLLKNLMIREGKNTGEVMVNLITSINSWTGSQRFRERLTTGAWAGRIHSLLWTTVIQSPGVPTWTEFQILDGEASIHEELRLETGALLKFEISADSFFQPNTHQAEVLYSKVVELAGLSGREVVYDLYCGTGTIGLFCAHAAKKIIGIEFNKEAVDNARSNARRNGIENAEFLISDVNSFLAHRDQVTPLRLEAPDVVIVDPPRIGLAPDVPRKIAEWGPPKIVYVSCNPSTLARDLKIFKTLNYEVKAVQPVDMFPQTVHIENVVLLTKG